MTGPRLDQPDQHTPVFEGRPLPHPDEPVFDQGLVFDVETLVTRRQLLQGFSYGAVAVSIAACIPGATTAPSPTAAEGTQLPSAASTGGTPTGAAEACEVIPEETAGPYPGDGSNGPDVLGQSGVVREDIRASFGTSSTVAGGAPLTIRLAVQDLANDCAPLANAAVYVWHCDQQGRYSMYSSGVENENYLRGVQAAAEDGVVTFTSIFPACYSGRWPHIHFEVFRDLDAASDDANKIATSQIALPEDICAEVYATSGYEQSAQTFAGVSLQRDNVFGEDAGARQMGTISGSVADRLTVELAVPVEA